jgi:hypothetical protein
MIINEEKNKIPISNIEYSIIRSLILSKKYKNSIHISSAIQISLANDNDKEIRRYLAGNIYVSPDAQYMLAIDNDDFVRGILAKNTNINTKTQNIIAADDNYIVLKSLARNPSINPQAQKILLECTSINKHKTDTQLNHDYHLKANLAENINIDLETQRILSTDDDYYVRRHLAKNKNLHIEIKKILIDDSSDYVLRELYNTHPDILIEINKADNIPRKDKTPIGTINRSDNSNNLSKIFSELISKVMR